MPLDSRTESMRFQREHRTRFSGKQPPALHVLPTYHRGMRTISLMLPEDLLAELEREAKIRHVTKSALVRHSLEEAFGRRPVID